MNKTLLHEIGAKHQTDKHDPNHGFAGSSYLDIYHRYLNGIRELPMNILEIGVRDGCSHRMWREYFPNSTIYGIDIDPRCKASQSDRIKIYIGSQSDPQITQAVCNDAGGQFDVVLDDGSHVNELTLKSFELLFSHVKHGGLYIIEDTGCTYYGEDLKNHIVRGQWPGMQFNQGVDFNNKREDMDSFFKRVISNMDGKTGEIEWVHFYSGFVIMKKIGAPK